jgi:hypothetical protein
MSIPRGMFGIVIVAKAKHSRAPQRTKFIRLNCATMNA